MELNFDQFLTTKEEELVYELPEADKKGPSIYSPKASDGVNNKYVSVLKLLPNPVNPKKPIVKSAQVYVDWPEIGFQGYVYSMLNWHKTCPIQERFYHYHKMSKNSKKYEDLKKTVKSTTNYYCLAQVVSDKIKPELVGKVVVFKFNQTIYKVISEALNPPQELLAQGLTRFDPFAIINSRNLILNLSQKAVENGVAYTDYSSVKFADAPSVIKVEYIDEDGETKSGEVKVDNPKSKFLLEKLYENVPNLDDYAPQEWDEATKKMINQWLMFLPSPKYPNGIPMDQINDDGVVFTKSSSEKSKKKEVEYKELDTDDTDNNEDVEEDDLESFLNS